MADGTPEIKTQITVVGHDFRREARNVCHNAADRLEHHVGQLRRVGDLLDCLGCAVVRVADHSVEGRTSSGCSRSASKGSRELFGPTETRVVSPVIKVSACERRPVASSECSYTEGHTTGASASILHLKGLS